MKKKTAAAISVLAALIMLALPMEGLAFQGKAALAIMLWAVCWWVIKPVPDFVTAMLMAALFMCVAGASMSSVCSAFSGATWWLLLTAFGLSLGVSRCGVIKRMALLLMRLFPDNYLGHILSLSSVGFVSAPFIPSLSAKSSMLAPLALGLSDSGGYERKSPQASGLFLAMLTGLRSPALLFISASPIGYTLRGYYSDEINRRFSMSGWFLAALPWFLVVTALNIALLYFFYRPKKEKLTAACDEGKNDAKLPPMSREEKYMSLIISAALLMWATENVHGIPAHVTAITALSLAIASGALPARDFCRDMNWDSVIFIGFALGIAQVFAELGVEQWIVSVFMPLFSGFLSSPVSFLVFTALVTVLLRFVIVSEMAFINIFLVFLLPLAEAAGINPWLVGFTVYTMISPWFFLYQNPVYMAAYHSVKGEMAEHRSIAAYCPVYLAVCLGALLLCMGWWMRSGVFYL